VIGGGGCGQMGGLGGHFICLGNWGHVGGGGEGGPEREERERARLGGRGGGGQKVRNKAGGGYERGRQAWAAMPRRGSGERWG
jgi:hypothetical protein